MATMLLHKPSNTVRFISATQNFLEDVDSDEDAPETLIFAGSKPQVKSVLHSLHELCSKFSLIRLFAVVGDKKQYMEALV